MSSQKMADSRTYRNVDHSLQPLDNKQQLQRSLQPQLDMQQQQQQQQLSAIAEIRQSLLREIKEINQDGGSTLKPQSAKSKRAVLGLGLSRKYSSGSNFPKPLPVVKLETTYNSQLDVGKDTSVHSRGGPTGEYTNPGSSKKITKANAGKKVLNVASLPFRSVKRRFASQTTNSDRSATNEIKGNAIDEDETKSSWNQTSVSQPSMIPVHDFPTDNKSVMDDFDRQCESKCTDGEVKDYHGKATNQWKGKNLRGNTNVSQIHRNNADNFLWDESIYLKERPSEDVMTTVVRQTESILRLCCIMFLAYCFGVHYPHYQVFVNKIGEYVLVAWTTCILIRSVTAYQQKHSKKLSRLKVEVNEREHSNPTRSHQRMKNTMSDIINDSDEYMEDAPSSHLDHNQIADQDVDKYDFLPQGEHRHKMHPSSPGKTYKGESSIDDYAESEHSSARANSVGELRNQHLQANVHPSLNPFYVVDISNTKRIFANTSVPYKLDTEYFVGEMLILIRTPNVDDVDKATTEVPGIAQNDGNAAAVNYFRGKLRRFEFQFQVKLKQVPSGRVYFACELSEAFKLGMIQRAFVGAAMAFVKSSNKSFHYSLSGTPCEPGETDSMRFESPHMAFPVEEGMNRLVATPPGKTPPKLGCEIEEDPESIKRRKKGIPIEYNTTDTYTFSLWSQYVDFLEWRCLNLPGIRPFSICSVIGPQAILLSVYEIRNNDSVTGKQQEKHFKSEMTNIITLEMCNAVESTVGPCAKKWIVRQRKGKEYDEKRNLEKLKTSQNKDVIEDEAKQNANTDDDVDGNADFVLGHDVGVRQDDIQLDDDETEIAAEELGEGFFVQSGAAIALREFSTTINVSANTSMEDVPSIDNSLPEHPLSTRQSSSSGASTCYVTNAGGFAVLHEETPQIIIIEKAGKSAGRGKNKSKLIKSGDTVIIKIATRGNKNDDNNQMKHLSIHRGWWLKWVSSARTANDYFTIHSKESEVTESGECLLETQSSYLTVGGAFYLKHKRWSKYHIGIAAEASTQFGGRVLGLHIPQKNGGVSNPEDFLNNLDDAELDFDNAHADEKPARAKNIWMRTLALQVVPVEVTGSAEVGIVASSAHGDNPDMSDSDLNGTLKTSMMFASGHYHLDVPAWLELFNRTERVRQHTYVVRVFPPVSTSTAESETGSDDDCVNKKDEAFVRFRTGRELAPLMRAGMKWRNNLASPSKFKPSAPPNITRSIPLSPGPSFRANQTESPGYLLTTPNVHTRSFSSSPSIADANDVSSVHSYDETENPGKFDNAEFSMNVLGLLDSVKQGDQGSESESASVSSDDSEQAEYVVDAASKRGKGRKLLGKVAKAVKTTAATTGSMVVRTTTNTGKSVVLGTVNVGKSILPIRSKNPPSREPKSSTRRMSMKQREKDLDVDLKSRSMKKMELLESRLQFGSPLVLAGELSAPEQSCRTVSNMLKKMSSESLSSSVEEGFSSLLSSIVQPRTELDRNFLKGGALQLGVSPTKADLARKWICDCVVARCLWESHWREEWCNVSGDILSFYAPRTDVPCLELSLRDLKSVRFLDSVETSPLPGYPLLVLETAWLCHCCAFINELARDLFYKKVEQARNHWSDSSEWQSGNELEQAHLWQGFQNSLDFSTALGKGKWAAVHSGSKLKSRIILNNRRLTFDQSEQIPDVNQFVEELLATALSFSVTSLKQHPEALIRFLDGTCRLRSLSLDAIDRSRKAGFCFFVNIYHCLLQHALLFSVNGPLHKRSIVHFMRTSCYEIGGDVFSLSELYSCVIRGNMSRPSIKKETFVDITKKSSAHQFYALSVTNPQTNFLLNTADLSCPRTVPVLNLIEMRDQMKSHVTEYLRTNIAVDTFKKVVHLPKLFEIYKSDYTLDEKNFAMACLQYALPYLLDETAQSIRALFQEDIVIKFQPPPEQYHSSLQPVEKSSISNRTMTKV